MSTTRRALMIAAAAVGAGLAAPAMAATREPFTDAAFDAAQKAGRSIIVDVTAPWCPTCKAQHPHVEATLASPEMKDTVLFEVDFDTQKEALRRFQVRMQSTIIAFKGATETGRATGVTDPAEIRALMLKAV